MAHVASSHLTSGRGYVGEVSFSSILGQPAAVQTLSRALQSGHVHHAYRFQGPPGVGKELAAFAFAAALVCERRSALGCGECSACHRAKTLTSDAPCIPQHPDVVLLEKGLYPASTLGTTSSGASGIGLAQIQRIVLDRVPYAPHEGKAIVFIFRDADLLTVRAANALLKTLEEPRSAIHFILLTHRPELLLDTIRSRSLPIRFGPLPDAALRDILKARAIECSPQSIALAGGSVQRAIELATPENEQKRAKFLQGIQSAIGSADLGPALQLAAAHKPDRYSLTLDLQALGHSYCQGAKQLAISDATAARQAAQMYEQAQIALGHLERNTPPILVLETLIARLRRVSRGLTLPAVG